MENAQPNNFMGRMTNWVEGKLAPRMAWFTENKYVSAIRQGFLDVIPLMLVGSIFLIIWLFPLDAWTNLIAPISGQLGVAVNYTFGLLGFVTTFTIAYRLAQNLELEPVAPSIFAMLGFLLLSPPVDGAIPLTFMGGEGLFAGILLAALSVLLMKLFYKYNITIRMPKQVPQGVANMFAAIPPGFVFLAGIWLVRAVLNFDVHSLILMLLQPLVVAGDSLLALNIEAIICHLAWSVGIHGYAIVQSVAMPFWTLSLSANTAAAAAGEAIPHIGTSMFLDGLALWSASTTWPVIVLLLASKLRSFRALGKLNAPAGLFCIWEPIMFGLPIILNPILIIPFILTAVWGVTVAWLAVFWGLVTAPYVMIPMIAPPFVSGYLATGGDWRSLILTLVVLVGATLIWYPFFKAWERIRATENPDDVLKAS